MLANYHTHTVRCKHAEGTEREYIESALACGMKILGFSDHVPQPFPKEITSGIRMQMEEIPEYIETLMKLREEYKDRIDILIGFEVEYSRKYFGPLMEELKKYPIDYLILGEHHVPDEVEGFYTGFATDREEDLEAYVEMTVEGMQTGVFTYLAHPDLIHYTGDDETYCRHMKKLIRASIDLDMPLEVNIYGFIDGRHYPCDRFWKLATEMGAKCVIGCDAHKPEVVRQPESIPGFVEFLERNHISYGDNIVKPVKPF